MAEHANLNTSVPIVVLMVILFQAATRGKRTRNKTRVKGTPHHQHHRTKTAYMPV